MALSDYGAMIFFNFNGSTEKYLVNVNGIQGFLGVQVAFLTDF